MEVTSALMGSRIAPNRGVLRTWRRPDILIPLILIAVLSGVAGVRAFVAVQTERQADERRAAELDTAAEFSPPIEFASWSNVGPSDVFLSAELSLEPENITSMTGMSYFPKSAYSEDGGGVLLVNPPSETKYGDAADAKPELGGVQYGGTDPWCEDVDGNVVTVGEIGAEFTFPEAGYLTGGEAVTIHVKLSNFTIRINRGASLTSSHDAAATGTGFTLGKGGTVSVRSSSDIWNTAVNSDGQYVEHALAEGQYVAAYGNMTFLSAFGTVPQAFARPLLFNQCYWGPAEDPANVSLSDETISDASSTWRVWDCTSSIDEHGRFAESHGRKDSSMYVAVDTGDGGESGEQQPARKRAYEDVVALQFDVDAYFTYTDYDGNEVPVEGVIALGMTGIDEPDRSVGTTNDKEFTGPYVESVTWRYGLTDNPIYVRKATWKTFHGEAAPGGAAFEYTTVSEGKNRMVDLDRLVMSGGLCFAASHAAGDAMTIDFDDDGSSLGEYLRQEATAGHMTLVRADGLGFTWRGSGAQCKVMSQGNISKYLSVAARGENTDKVTIEDAELSTSAGLLYEPLLDEYLFARGDEDASLRVYTYRPPWKSKKTLVAKADEGYHISRVIISDIYDDQTTESDEGDLRHGESEVSDDEKEGVRGDVHEVIFEVGKVLPEGTTLSGYWDGVTVNVADDGSVIINPTIRCGTDPLTGEILTGFTKDVYVRVEAVSDEHIDTELAGPDELDQAFIL